MKHYKGIEVNPEIMCGKPVIKGTRVTVELILKKLSEGLTPAEIITEHPTIKLEDVYAAGPKKGDRQQCRPYIRVLFTYSKIKNYVRIRRPFLPRMAM